MTFSRNNALSQPMSVLIQLLALYQLEVHFFLTRNLEAHTFFQITTVHVSFGKVGQIADDFGPLVGIQNSIGLLFFLHVLNSFSFDFL